MSAKITAVAQVTSKNVSRWNAQEKSTGVKLSAAYSNPENKAWALATPVFNVDITVKDELADFFDFDGEYLVTFEKKDAH
jgi:hypothetical protein